MGTLTALSLSGRFNVRIRMWPSRRERTGSAGSPVAPSGSAVMSEGERGASESCRPGRKPREYRGNIPLTEVGLKDPTSVPTFGDPLALRPSVPVRDSQHLQDTLHRIDGRQYKAYRDLVLIIRITMALMCATPTATN